MTFSTTSTATMPTTMPTTCPCLIATGPSLCPSHWRRPYLSLYSAPYARRLLPI